MTGHVVAALEARGGVAAARDILGRGVTRAALARAVRDGWAVRVRHGIYALGRTSPAVLAAAAHGGAVACVTALALWGGCSPIPDCMSGSATRGAYTRTPAAAASTIMTPVARRSASCRSPMRSCMRHDA